MNENITGRLILDANECCEIKRILSPPKEYIIKLGQLHFEANILVEYNEFVGR